jgi:hypothetical protein
VPDFELTKPRTAERYKGADQTAYNATPRKHTTAKDDASSNRFQGTTAQMRQRKNSQSVEDEHKQELQGM